MSPGTATRITIAAIAAVFWLPPLLAWLTGKLWQRRDRRTHPWCCDCGERLQDARSRHPAGTGMPAEDAALWAEIDALEDWDRTAGEAESFSADPEDQ